MFFMVFCLTQNSSSYVVVIVTSIKNFLLVRGGDRKLTNLVGNLTKGNETAKTAVLVITKTDI